MRLSRIAFAAPCLWALVADAQQTGKVFRIGLLDPSDARSSAVRLEAFWQEIRKLGWIEGNNFTIESRFGEEKTGRLPSLQPTSFVLRSM